MTTTSVTTSTTSGQYTISNGNELLVNSGGSVTDATIQYGGLLVVAGGVDSGAIVSAGAIETVSSGTVGGDQIYGVLSNLSGAVTHLNNEVIENGGVFQEVNSGVVSGTEVLGGGALYINGNTSGANTNTILSGGGLLELESAKATIGGTLTFAGGENILAVSATTSAGYGDQAVITGFSILDKIDAMTISNTTSSFSTNAAGNNVLTLNGTSGTTAVSESFVFTGTTTYNSNTLKVVSDGAKGEYIEYIGTSATVGAGPASSGLTVSANETLTVQAGGSVVSTIVQSLGLEVVSGGGSATTILAGGAELVVGSASGDQIYGVVSTVSGGAATMINETVQSGGQLDLLNGNTASATVVLSGGSLNINGAATATDITLSGGGTLELLSPKATAAGSLNFVGSGNTLVIGSVVTTSAGAFGEQAVISNFATSDKIDVTAIAATGATLSFTSNGGNEVVTISGTSGTSPVVESFVFSGTTTYDNLTMGLQADGAGVDLVYNPNATTYTVSSGVQSGLNVISGETVSVLSGATVSATNVMSGGTLVVSGSDFAANIAAGGAETVYGSASGDQILGGVALVGPGAVVSGETVSAGGSLAVDAGSNQSATILAGGAETVAGAGVTSGDQIYGSATDIGGSVNGETVQSGGSLTISAGTDTGTTISAGGNETVLTSASGDQIFGTQLVSAATAVVTGETVHSGGNLDVFLKGAIASGTTVLSGGSLNVSGNAYAIDTTLSGGGSLVLESPKAVVSGFLNMVGSGNVLEITGTTSAGFGVESVISGFTASDKIDITSTAYVDSGLSVQQSFDTNGNTVANVLSGGVVSDGVLTGATTIETFTFLGAESVSLASDGNGGALVETGSANVTTSVTTPTASGAFTETATNNLLVQGGGVVFGATIDSQGALIVNGGAEFGATIQVGGVETISAGAASGDQIFGAATATGGALIGETVQSGALLTIGGDASATNTVLNGGATLVLATPTAGLSGTLTFANGFNTLEASAIANAGAGDQASITGFQSNDKIDVTGISATDAQLSFASNAAGGDIATISGTGGSESFVFANATTYNASTMSLISDGSGGVDLVLNTTPVVAFTSLGGETNKTSQIVNGKVDTTVDPEAAGSIVTVSEGSTVLGTATVGANGYWSANVSLLNGSGANVLTASDTDAAKQTGTTTQSLTYNVDTTAAAFIPGNLVISIYGDGAGTGSYTLDQAAPITLEQITTSGAYVGQLVLPETTTTVNGVTEYAISGEYGSASEGFLQLSADGHSLTIVGYGVNYQAFDASTATSIYGTNALGQTTSLSTATTTIVPRVIADISASGTIDTSTALDNVFNSNNPRSVVTVDGSGFWLTGQGVKGDTTQGVFYASDGSTTATAINTATDTRVAEIYNGQLYVSADSTQGATNISDYGALPTSKTAPVVLNAISNSVVLTAATANTVNASAIGTSVNLSPEAYYFANSTTLYVADGGVPKNGGIGDGGLQKWVDVGGVWTLQYTLSNGLNLVPDTQTSGVSGLIGLTGQVVNGNVELYATSEGVGELDQSYLYSITDPLASTTGAGESFTTVMAAGANQIIRGVSFAPTASSDTICFMAGTMIRTPDGETPVEMLKRGDLVLTSDGATAPVTWLGKQTIAAAFADPTRSWPIRVKAGALDENVPCRDLLLSPDHALLVDGVLIHAGALVNGTSIIREAKVEPIFVYYHVELDDHSLILAENTPAETFIDNVERLNFDNWAEHEALYPNGKAIDELALPRAKGRRQVPMQVRAKLDARAQIIGETKTQAVA